MFRRRSATSRCGGCARTTSRTSTTSSPGPAGGEPTFRSHRKQLQSEALVRNPTVGRALVSTFRETALDDIVLRGWVSIITDYDFAVDALGIEQTAQRAVGTYIDERERDHWLAVLRRAAIAGPFSAR